MTRKRKTKKKEEQSSPSALSTLNCTPEIKTRDATSHFRLQMLTLQEVPVTVPEYRARRTLWKRFVNVSGTCSLHWHHCKGTASVLFKAGLGKRAASQLLQEGCRSPRALNHCRWQTGFKGMWANCKQNWAPF